MDEREDQVHDAKSQGAPLERLSGYHDQRLQSKPEHRLMSAEVSGAHTTSTSTRDQGNNGGT
eukprot:704554-Ditylum_brightwellii.AAC.1